MTKTKFILKELLWSSGLTLVLIFISLVIEYSFEQALSISNIPWILVLLLLIDLCSFIYNLYQLKKLGIDIGLERNQNGSLTQEIKIPLAKNEILEKLKQNVWKFKTESKKETADGTLLKMKFYRALWNEKVEILVQELNEHDCLVSICSGYNEQSKFWSAHHFWTNAIKNIQYFKQVLAS